MHSKLIEQIKVAQNMMPFEEEEAAHFNLESNISAQDNFNDIKNVEIQSANEDAVNNLRNTQVDGDKTSKSSSSLSDKVGVEN